MSTYLTLKVVTAKKVLKRLKHLSPTRRSENTGVEELKMISGSVSNYHQEGVKVALAADYKNLSFVKDNNPEISEALYPVFKNNSHLLGLVKFKHLTFAIPGFAEDAFTEDSIIDLLLCNKFLLVTTPTELNSISVHASPEKQQENATLQTVVGGRTFDDLVLSNTQNFLLEERWFLQLSYYVLLRQSGQPALDFDISSTQLEKSPNMDSDSNWEIANGYYKNVAMVQLLRQIRLNFHKDFSLEQGKVMMREFHSGLEPRDLFDASGDGVFLKKFTESVKGTFSQIMQAFRVLDSLSNVHTLSEDSSSGNITLWKSLSESCLGSLQLDLICEKLGRTSISAVELVRHAGYGNPSLCFQVQTDLKRLHVSIDLILMFGNALLLEFLAMHRTVAEITHTLANFFASLYSNGYGDSPEEQVDNTNGDRAEDASGTGMGEGTGLNDVSDQITDEDQLIGLEDKPSEGQDASNEVPSKDGGVEMDDFEADKYSVSEDSGDEADEAGEDEKLESAMGEVGDDGEIADESHWDKDEDNNPDTKNEKYETGSSVKDADGGKELRAKEDDATTLDESEEMNADEPDKQRNDNENEDENIPDDTENMDDMKLDKEEAYADPTGIQLDDQKQGSDEDMNIEEPEGSDAMEEVNPEESTEHSENTENGRNAEDEKTSAMEEDMEVESAELGDNGETDDPGMDHDDSTEKDLMGPGKTSFEKATSDFTSDPVPIANSATRPNGDSQASEASTVAPEVQWSNSNNMQNGLAPSRGLPSSNVPEMEITVPDSAEDGKLTSDVPKSESEQRDTSSTQRTQPNPYRSVGDALEKWKERVKVSVDSQENKTEASDDMEDENADEYGFVAEFENGTSQALGPATSDQMDKNIKGEKPEGGEDQTKEKASIPEMEVENQDSQTLPARNHSASTHRQNVDEKTLNSDISNDTGVGGSERSNDGENHEDDRQNLSGDLVSIRRSYMSENILQLSQLTVNDEELGTATVPEEVSGDMKENATTLWRRYELSTTRLSQELAEQLRLVMEPTVASKLQGDYKTGKRINMKKVIPYIASHYRKDKIWLRRTRPNKRDYQVIVAVDDSSSMSASSCGNAAVEALVTVCRAMSQLEVGQLAVASFGTKGNIKLLHDFNQPFTGEAGIQMVSSLTFKQENTLHDEPVVDLLKFLNDKLDSAMANSRLPSGQSPLQQLILIIADGRFHEKEKLKRYVRNVLSKKRMVAFLLIDSPKESNDGPGESISDFMEATFKNGKWTFQKYLNSFPFPYYIILKNMDALPRTLGDLLRQWFELMQSTRD